jgi:hypothetical protein
VAQNGQAIPQPAWLDTQTVARSGYRIRTLSSSVPSCARHNDFLVAPLSQLSARASVSSGGSSSPTRAARERCGMSVMLGASTLSRAK